MKKMMITLAAVALCAFAGCRNVYVANNGEDVIRNKDGSVLVDKDGNAQKCKKGWVVDQKQHWMWTVCDGMHASINPDGTITFDMNGLNSQPSSNLTALVTGSLAGVAELATKVGAAIATSGGSVATEAAASGLSAMVNKFIAAGGDASKATVTCSGGNCTVTDGTVTETCTNCVPTTTTSSTTSATAK